jgi:cation diffusion facilitator CzcD-associated flavoprotein CzcO
MLWVDTKQATDDEAEAAAPEREDFEQMQGIRSRSASTAEAPETAEKLKPWYGKNCKRVCFHDEYLPSFNLANVHLVDTDGRGVEAITKEGVVVEGV